MKNESSTVRVRFTLSNGFYGKREEIMEFDQDEVPDDPTLREEWLEEQWSAWAHNYIDGSATILED